MNLLKLKSQNKAKKIPMVLPNSQPKKLELIGPKVHELRSEERTDKQRLQLYIDKITILIDS